MPNVKIYIDQELPEQVQLNLRAILAPLREIICTKLQVGSSACQFAILPAYVMADLPAVNVEIAILPKPERTRPMLTDLAEEIQRLMANAVEGCVAVRLSLLDPVTYIALK